MTAAGVVAPLPAVPDDNAGIGVMSLSLLVPLEPLPPVLVVLEPLVVDCLPSAAAVEAAAAAVPGATNPAAATPPTAMAAASIAPL